MGLMDEQLEPWGQQRTVVLPASTLQTEPDEQQKLLGRLAVVHCEKPLKQSEEAADARSQKVRSFEGMETADAPRGVQEAAAMSSHAARSGNLVMVGADASPPRIGV